MPPHSRFYTVKPDVLHDLTSEAVSGNSQVVRTQTARTAEIWITTSAGAGGPSFDFIVETGIDAAGPFVEQTRQNAVVADGLIALVINRADHALGTHMRLRWVRNAGSFDIAAKIVRLE